MKPDEFDDAARLSRTWDELGENGTALDDVDSELLASIHRIEDATRVPPPPPDLAASMWERLTGESLPLIPLVTAPAKGTNGHHPVTAAANSTARRMARRRQLVTTVFRAVAIGTMAGFAAGFVAGLWMRVAMRLSGYLTVDANRGLLTENDAVVGKFTLAGTLSIAMFGAIVGIFGGLLYIAIRRWIPGNAWLRPVLYGGLLLGVLGFVVMDQNNPDYRLFGPPWLNVGMCSLTYIVFGVLASVLVDWLDRRVPQLGNSVHSRRRTVVTGIALAPFAAVGSLATVVSVIGPLGLIAPVIVLMAIIGGFAFLLYRRVQLVRTLPIVVMILRRPALVGYAAFAVPSLIGLVLTLRAITAIVGG